MSLAGGIFGLFAVLFTPAFALGRHLAPGRPFLTRALIGLALAPMAVALPALALAALTRMPLPTAAALTVFVWVAAAGWQSRPRPSAPEPERAETPVPALPVALLALFAVTLVALPPLLIPFVRYWSDAWFHAGAAIEVARHGVPPQDPNFAGIPFYYPWLFHGLLAVLMEISGRSPFALQMVINVWAAAVLVLAAAHLAGLVGGRRAAAWAGAIALFGLNPLGWGPLLARASLGEDRNLGRFWVEMGNMNGAMSRLAFGEFPHVQASLLNRFWTGTALTPAIALALALAWSLADALGRPAARSWVRSFVIALAMAAFHPAYGMAAIAALGLALVASLRHGVRGRAWAGLAVLAVVGALALPYVRACSIPGATTGVRLGLYLPNLWSFAAAMGPWWLVAAFGVGPARRAGPAGRFALAALGAAVLMGLFLVLPERNTEKMAYLAWTLLAPLAAAGIGARGASGRRFARWVAPLALALMVPTTALYVAGVARENRSPGVLFRDETPVTRALPLETPAEAEAHRMLREQTPAHAVVIERRHLIVNEAAPVLTGRRAFCGSLDVYLANHFGGVPWGLALETEELPGVVAVRGFWATGSRGFVVSRRAVMAPPPTPAYQALREEFLVRRAIQLALFRDGGTLSEAQRAYLTSFDAPLLLVVRRWEESDAVWERFERDPLWDPAFRNAEVRIYWWRG